MTPLSADLFDSPSIGRLEPEIFLRVAFQLKEDELWAKAGTEIAANQFELPLEERSEDASDQGVASPAFTPAEVKTDLKPTTITLGLSPDDLKEKLQPETKREVPVGEVKFTQDEKQITVSGAAFQAVFDRETGALSDLVYDGAHIIVPGTGGLKLNAYRAPHLNDDLWASKGWKEIGLDHLEQRASSVTATQIRPGAVQVRVEGTAEGKDGFGFAQTTVYHVMSDGVRSVEEKITPHGKRIVLPRIGARVMLDPALDHFTYFGRGPMENYPDRKLGSDIGLYDTAVKDQLTAYVRPMECGNHEDVRWCAITRGTGGAGVLVFSGATHPLGVSALPYSDEQLEKAPYAKDLSPSVATVLCLSAKTLGVGTGSCGPHTFPQYQIFSDPVAYSYMLRPVPAGTTDYFALIR